MSNDPFMECVWEAWADNDHELSLQAIRFKDYYVLIAHTKDNREYMSVILRVEEDGTISFKVDEE